jgi:hypothetical protein
MSSAPNVQSDADQLEAAADQAIAACGGDAREAVKALIVANHFLETFRLRSRWGYARGNCSRSPRRCRMIARIGMIDQHCGSAR